MPELAALQRRTLRVLVGAEVLAALGGSGAAAGALLALDVTGREALASLPLAALVVGSSAAVVPVSALSRRAGRRAGLTAALATVVTANFVMAMAPVHMEGHGHSLEVVGLVVSLHIAGMFAPSPLIGWLTHRCGALPVATAGAVLLGALGPFLAASTPL